jgi:hypothetical protein
MRRSKAVDVRAVALFVARGTRRAAITLAGFALICLGIAGLVLPILPGWILIIGGFAVWSREYSWAASGLALARRHAARSGRKLRSMAMRRPPAAGDPEPSGEVVIDLTGLQGEAANSASSESNRPHASNIG